MATKNQSKAAHDARIQIGSPFADVPSAQIAFGLINPVTLALAAYVNSSGQVIFVSSGQSVYSTLSITDTTTPTISLAAGSTNTGTITINGKTSGKLVLTTADATGQTVTIKPAAQTSGAVILTTPDFAGVNDTFAFITKAQTFANKTLTAPVINGATSASGNFDLSGSTGTFLTPTGAATFGGSTNTFTNALTMGTASKGLVLKQGANGLVGTFVCNGATPVTVSNSNVAVTDAIVVSLNTVGGTVGAVPAVKTITASTGFTIAGTASDTSTYNYAIIKNAA